MRKVLTGTFPYSVDFRVRNTSKPPDEIVGRIFGGIDACLLSNRLQEILRSRIGIAVRAVFWNDDILPFCSIVRPFTNALRLWLVISDVLATWR